MMQHSATAVRAFVGTLAALLVAVLLADGAAAQVIPAAEHRTGLVQERTSPSSGEGESFPVDSRSPRRTRVTAHTPSPAANPLHMCGSDSPGSLGSHALVTSAATAWSAPGAHVRATRSARIPVLHQVFRC